MAWNNISCEQVLCRFNLISTLVGAGYTMHAFLPRISFSAVCLE